MCVMLLRSSSSFFLNNSMNNNIIIISNVLAGLTTACHKFIIALVFCHFHLGGVSSIAADVSCFFDWFHQCHMAHMLQPTVSSHTWPFYISANQKLRKTTGATVAVEMNFMRTWFHFRRIFLLLADVKNVVSIVKISSKRSPILLRLLKSVPPLPL